MKLFSSSRDPEPMTDQDLCDWGRAVDARSGVSLNRGPTPESVINAGQAIVDITNDRRRQP